ncbi:hypothetical protein [Dactylosporangium sp. NPDC005555]|uniref:hypothetical protein n=1 Tax=Dactylosporangium sp. NPDC005555 TaxID=3154889 RepID=UPI0033A3C6A3
MPHEVPLGVVVADLGALTTGDVRLDARHRDIVAGTDRCHRRTFGSTGGQIGSRPTALAAVGVAEATVMVVEARLPVTDRW